MRLTPHRACWGSFALTTLIALAATFLAALIGVPAGQALGPYRFRGKGLVTLLLLAPAVLPGLMTAGLFAFLVSWSQYLLTLAIGGGKVQTLPLLMFSFSSAGRNDLTWAIALLYILPGVLVLILTARQVTGRGAALSQGLRP